MEKPFATLGVGEVNMTLKKGLDAPDGGKRLMTGSILKLYHPSDTPDGNLEADLLEAGVLIGDKK